MKQPAKEESFSKDFKGKKIIQPRSGKNHGGKGGTTSFEGEVKQPKK